MNDRHYAQPMDSYTLFHGCISPMRNMIVVNMPRTVIWVITDGHCNLTQEFALSSLCGQQPHFIIPEDISCLIVIIHSILAAYTIAGGIPCHQWNIHIDGHCIQSKKPK